MSKEGADTTTATTGRWFAGIFVVGLIAIGLFSATNRDGGEDTTSTSAPPAGPETPTAEGDGVAESTPGPDADALVAEAPEPEAQVTPTVDEVRLEADGLAVVAGRAEPGAEVSVQIDGEEVATAQADAQGAFAAVGVVAPSADARVLTLQAEHDGEAIQSDEDIILAPLQPEIAEATPLPPDDPVVEIAEAPSVDQRETATEPEVVAEASPGEVEEDATGADEDPTAPRDEIAALDPNVVTSNPSPAEAAGAQTDTASQSAAEVETDLATPDPAQSVAILRSTSEGVELLQPAPEAMTSVAIDTIGYSSAGEVQLSGRAVVGTSEVRVYLNNRFAASIPVDIEGGWRGDLPEVDAGIYQLRVDEVNAAGVVTSRIETPFKREAPVTLAQADETEGPVRAITVQTGDTLWAIARDRYGEGVLYVKVFEANRADIRDPDLIYPGQVFDLPVE